MRPVLEYGNSVWDPHTKCLQEELEKVQNRAARFVTRNYTFEEAETYTDSSLSPEEGSMTGILQQLKWESLKKRRTDNRLILLYKGLKGKARIPTDDLIPKTSRCRNSHSKAFQLPSASIEAYKCSFFPQTIRDWNDFPDWLCIKPVTEPDQTEPTEITELTRPNLRELPNVPDRTYGKCRYIDTGI